ncbi:hypothetical protein ACFWUW_09610 [Streptomyces sp. NPDC058655]|uniref:hypothetical protein n=1 Tax=Streptomyces sp. NPDC058655 TaxID=3346577 RepID=UPI00365D0F6D
MPLNVPKEIKRVNKQVLVEPSSKSERLNLGRGRKPIGPPVGVAKLRPLNERHALLGLAEDCSTTTVVYDLAPYPPLRPARPRHRSPPGRLRLAHVRRGRHTHDADPRCSAGSHHAYAQAPEGVRA